MRSTSATLSNRGFTIVELLVVIVVLAILATLTVVAFNGISNRAHSSAIVTHIRQWETLFESYIAVNGSPPAADWRCLGNATTLPAENGYAENYCFKPTNITAGNGANTTAPADPALMQTLLSVNLGSGLPGTQFPESPGFMSNSDEGMQVRTFRGVFYDSANQNTADLPAVIGYYVKGPTCPIGLRMSYWTTDTTVSGCFHKLSVNQSGQLRGQCNIGPSHALYNSYVKLDGAGSTTRYCYRGNIATP